MRTLLSAILALSAVAIGARGVEGPRQSEQPTSEGDVRERFAALEKAQEEASARYATGLAEAGNDPEIQAAVDRYLADMDTNAQAALKLAAEHPDDPIAVDVLTFVIRIARAGPGDQSKRAIELLTREHVESAGVSRACAITFYFMHWPEAEALTRAVMERNPHHQDRGQACSILATTLEYKAGMIRRLRTDPEFVERLRESYYGEVIDRLIRDGDPERLMAEVESLLERSIREFGDLPYDPFEGKDQRTLGEVDAGRLFALRHLSVGKVAPEIQGKDAEGREFRLSDSRGKVVVLTFSGNWCGPCVAMYPHERKLVERSKEEPIAVLSVNTDDKVETLRSAIQSGKITWPCWWDGGTDGPITTRWGINGFPTVYVLDPEGVIRYKDVPDEKLDSAIDQLLKEQAEP